MKNDSIKQPLVIGVSGISGSGKSALIKKLATTLKSTTLFWDDFDEISTGPEDYVKWFESSKNYNDWIYNELAETLKKLKDGQTVICPATKKELLPTKYILFDAPLGYCHQATGSFIDFLVCLDTPPDIALARRLLRDHKTSTSEKIFEELNYYLSHSRPLFILSEEQKICDLYLDGSLPLQEGCNKVLTFLHNIEQTKNKSNINIKFQILSDELKKKIYEGFSRHAISMTGYDEKSNSVAFVAEDKKGAFAGAIVVEIFWGALHVKYLYVEEVNRKQGIATKLMQKALEYAQNKQCSFAFVETMNFQALEFYQKVGFKVEFSRSGYKHNTSFYYLCKRLDLDL